VAIRQLVRPAVFVLVAALHAALLLLLSQHDQIPVLARRNTVESLFLLILPRRVPPSAERYLLHPRPAQPKTPLPKPAAQPPQAPLVEPPPNESEPLSIDWIAEAELAAERQAQSAGNSNQRALDRHTDGADLNGGLGPDNDKKTEFGWSHSRIHRVEALQGGGSILWLNDRCFLILVGIPFPMCRIGKVPARGDLFDHMRDSRDP
jgi:hypothetical protein